MNTYEFCMFALGHGIKAGAGTPQQWADDAIEIATVYHNHDANSPVAQALCGRFHRKYDHVIYR